MAKFQYVALACLAMAAAPAFAQPPERVTMLKVGYSDLDLSTEAGAATLMQRVAKAAKRICATNPAFESRNVQEARANCEATIMANAQVDVASAVSGNVEQGSRE